MPGKSRIGAIQVEPSTAPVPPPALQADPGATLAAHGEPPARTRVAVIIAHGMGQQVPFETLDGIAEALAGQISRHLKQDTTWQVRQVQTPSGKRFARVETSLPARDGSPRDVHLYEVYWAPLTEGTISTRETFLFLKDAALQGIRAVLQGHFHRFMFGSWHCFRVPARSLLGFLAAGGVLMSLLLMNLVVMAAVLDGVAGGLELPWPVCGSLGLLIKDASWFIVAIVVLLLLGVVVPSRLRRPAAAGGRRAAPAWIALLGLWCTYGAVLISLVVGLVMAYHATLGDFVIARQKWELLPLPLMATPSPQPLMLLAIGIPLLIASMRVQWFLRQYVGDVAVYVSAYKADRFSDARAAIQEAGQAVGRFVYGLRETPEADPYYDRVLVVGHSLGSVVAYDLLNALLRDDQARTAGERLRVQDRTGALLTYGSPLDKVALIFRQQLRSDRIIREALAAAVQPLMQAAAFRTMRWINIWTVRDWISGELNYFDPPPGVEPAPFRIKNVIDRDATTPIMAHTEYESGRAFPRLLYREIVR